MSITQQIFCDWPICPDGAEPVSLPGECCPSCPCKSILHPTIACSDQFLLISVPSTTGTPPVIDCGVSDLNMVHVCMYGAIFADCVVCVASVCWWNHSSCSSRAVLPSMPRNWYYSWLKFVITFIVFIVPISEGCVTADGRVIARGDSFPAPDGCNTW